jgi:hypothetical protein
MNQQQKLSLPHFRLAHFAISACEMQIALMMKMMGNGAQQCTTVVD